jgi:hypothetical protein
MPHTKAAFDCLENLMPVFQKNLQPKSLLYIGWRYDCRPWWYNVFCKNMGIENVAILEIFPKNIADFEMAVWAGHYKARAIHGDARTIDKYVRPGEFDVIFWDHGPEHITREELPPTTDLLYSVAGKLLLYCCPWGEWPQGAEDNNEHEIHRNYVSDQEFRDMGLQTLTFGSSGQNNAGELIGYKYK